MVFLPFFSFHFDAIPMQYGRIALVKFYIITTTYSKVPPLNKSSLKMRLISLPGENSLALRPENSFLERQRPCSRYFGSATTGGCRIQFTAGSCCGVDGKAGCAVGDGVIVPGCRKRDRLGVLGHGGGQSVQSL